MRIELGLAFLAISLSGCATQPYVKPTVNVPSAYKEGGDAFSPAAPRPGWIAAMPRDAQDRGAWWEVFGNPQLNELESRVSVSNQTIQKAVATLQQARAAAGVARSSYYPTVTAGVAQDRFHTSQNVVGRSLAGTTVSDYSVGVDASWEPDLFGKIGYAISAATARAQASEADLASVRLSMQAELAVDYFDLHGSDAEIILLQKTVATYQDALDLVQHRFAGGIASDYDVAQAQTQLETTQSQLIDLDVARAQLEHAIATLIGEPASNFSLSTDGSQLTPPAIPTGVPSQLLERRPDVAAAERRVAGSNADIGGAKAAFFPDLILSASGGLESSSLANFLAMPSRYWAIGPALIGTVFDGRRLSANRTDLIPRSRGQPFRRTDPRRRSADSRSGRSLITACARCSAHSLQDRVHQLSRGHRCAEHGARQRTRGHGYCTPPFRCQCLVDQGARRSLDRASPRPYHGEKRQVVATETSQKRRNSLNRPRPTI